MIDDDDDDDVMMIWAKTSSKFYIICTEKCQILNVERLNMLNPAKATNKGKASHGVSTSWCADS